MKDKITKIEIQKKNLNRVNIYINNDYAFSCSKELVYTYNLSANKEVEMETLNNIIAEDNYIKCKNSALRIIERTYKSEKELFDKLMDKGYDENTIISVVEFLKKYNFLDDLAYTKMYIKDKIKAEGKNKIKFALIKKGIAEEIIKQELENIDEEIQSDTAMVIAEKKLKSLQRSENDIRKLYKKLGDYLMRKGFQWEEIRSILNKLLKEDNLEE